MSCTIVYDDGQDHSSVNVAGEFSAWQQLDMAHGTGTAFKRAIEALSPGLYMYKFIVDGRWTLMNDGRPSSMHFLQESNTKVDI